MEEWKTAVQIAEQSVSPFITMDTMWWIVSVDFGSRFESQSRYRSATDATRVLHRRYCTQPFEGLSGSREKVYGSRTNPSESMTWMQML